MGAFRTFTDETLRETARHGSAGYPFAYYTEDIWKFDFHCVDWHWHHEVEFLYVARGTAVFRAGKERIELSRGSGLFLNSGVIHRYEADASNEIPNIVFSPSLLAPEESLIYKKYIAPVLHGGVPCQRLDPDPAWQKRILELLLEVFELQQGKQPGELRTVRLLMEIWEILGEHLALDPEQPEARHLDYRQARLQTMMQYIHDHYTEEITLENIAEAGSVSKSSALQIFRSDIHISPVAYLIQYRLSRAAGQLCDTRKSVSAIAAENGFSSAGYFCRKFRQVYAMSPIEYRKRRSYGKND